MPRITVYIEENEWWPVYTARKTCADRYCTRRIEVASRVLERWRNAEREFNRAQREMSRVYERATPVLPLPPEWLLGVATSASVGTTLEP